MYSQDGVSIGISILATSSSSAAVEGRRRVATGAGGAGLVASGKAEMSALKNDCSGRVLASKRVSANMETSLGIHLLDQNWNRVSKTQRDQ